MRIWSAVVFFAIISKESTVTGTGTVVFFIIIVVVEFAVEGIIGVVVFATGIVKGLLPVPVEVPVDAGVVAVVAGFMVVVAGFVVFVAGIVVVEAGVVVVVAGVVVVVAGVVVVVAAPFLTSTVVTVVG